MFFQEITCIQLYDLFDLYDLLFMIWRTYNSCQLEQQRKSPDQIALNEFVIYRYNAQYLKDFLSNKSTLLELKVSSWLCSILHPNEYSLQLKFHDFFCIRLQYFQVFTKCFHEIPVSSNLMGFDWQKASQISARILKKTFRCLKLKTNFHERSSNNGKNILLNASTQKFDHSDHRIYKISFKL